MNSYKFLPEYLKYNKLPNRLLRDFFKDLYIEENRITKQLVILCCLIWTQSIPESIIESIILSCEHYKRSIFRNQNLSATLLKHYINDIDIFNTAFNKHFTPNSPQWNLLNIPELQLYVIKEHYSDFDCIAYPTQNAKDMFKLLNL